MLHPKVFLGKFGSKNWSFPNWLKFGTRVYCYIFISNLVFFNSSNFSHIFLGQIWSQNLKFSKLTEIWYRDTLLCAYYDFNVYCFKIIFIHIFWANLVLKSNVFQIDWNLIQGHKCLLLFINVWGKFHSKMSFSIFPEI